MGSIGCLRMGMRALIGYIQASTAADLNDSSRLIAGIEISELIVPKPNPAQACFCTRTTAVGGL